MRLFHIDLHRLTEVQNSFPTMGHTASTPGRLFWEVSGGHRDLHGQVQSPGTLTPFRPSRGGINVFGNAGPSSSHSLCDERVGNGIPIEAVRSSLSSVRMSGRQTGVRRSRKVGEARNAADQVKDTLRRKFTPRRKLSELQAYIAQVSLRLLVEIKQSGMKPSYHSFRQLPSQPTAPPILWGSRRHGTSALIGKRAGRNALSNSGV